MLLAMEALSVSVPESLPTIVIVFFGTAFLFRLATLSLSIRHESLLKQSGATEYGSVNSLILALSHVGFYICALGEGVYKHAAVDSVTITGFILYLLSALVLLFVIHLLGNLWTVKLLISPEHVLVDHAIFRLFRHPNYFLNIIPELVGMALALHAFVTISVGFALYLIPLSIRIKEEEKVMHRRFPTYAA